LYSSQNKYENAFSILRNKQFDSICNSNKTWHACNLIYFLYIIKSKKDNTNESIESL